jgi:hypothetical protein
VNLSKTVPAPTCACNERNLDPMATHRFVIYPLVLALLGCAGVPSEPGGLLRVTDVHRESSTGARVKREEIITSADRWREVWEEIVSNRWPKPAPPPVDFSSTALVYVARGETGDACRSVRITRVEVREGHATVFVRDSRPPVSCSCPPITIQPVHVVAIPRVTASSSFQYENEIEGPACE